MGKRVLILDFDFHTSVGGGQVLYRRIVERNPAIDFYYPSRGPDLKLAPGRIPANAFPFAFDNRLDVQLIGEGWLEHHYVSNMCAIGAAIQGMSFHAVDVPSFYPVAHLARSILTSYGVQMDKVVLGMVGWQTVSVKNGYEPVNPDTLSQLERAEQLATESADGRYTISNLEQAENARTALPVDLIDMKDAIEWFGLPDPEPPGEGQPDLWYVGRLDGAKGPDLFIELVARMPRALYNRCYFSGPDNTWTETDRWSQHLLNLAASRGIEAAYEGVLSDAEIRSRVYRGRTVLVVPSRTDAFNYVSMEAVLNGCPLLLSNRAGALGFLRQRYPHLAPEEMDPNELDQAAERLHGMLADYAQLAAERRRTLISNPFPSPREGFMQSVYDVDGVRSPGAQKTVGTMTKEFRDRFPLLTEGSRDWRPQRTCTSTPRVSIVIPTLDRPALLAPTLACLTRQTFSDLEVIVIDDGGTDSDRVRAVAESFSPMVRFIRVTNAGEAAAVNKGIAAARGEYVGFLSDDDAYAPELISQAVAALDENGDAIGTYPDWDIVDTAGYLVEAHRLPEFSRQLMLCAHWCLPGPGVIIRRQVLKAIGGRDISFRFVSDFDLWLRATAHGPMIHLPQRLAFWRLHASNLTTSEKNLKMANERITLMDKFFADPDERLRSAKYRSTAYAAAHLAAAAILGEADPDQALIHISRSRGLDPSVITNLPPNMVGYPSVWPSSWLTAGNCAQ